MRCSIFWDAFKRKKKREKQKHMREGSKQIPVGGGIHQSANRGWWMGGFPQDEGALRGKWGTLWQEKKLSSNPTGQPQIVQLKSWLRGGGGDEGGPCFRGKRKPKRKRKRQESTKNRGTKQETNSTWLKLPMKYCDAGSMEKKDMGGGKTLSTVRGNSVQWIAKHGEWEINWAKQGN